MSRILLTGALGMLGRRIREVLSDGHEVNATGRNPDHGVRALDVTDPDLVREALLQYKPDWVVNAAAYTAVDRAEEEPELAFAVNAGGPANLARAAVEAGARMLHVSTDFVFDGLKPEPYVETDPVGPIDVYARSKEEGERRVREILDDHVILRVAWLYGPDGGNFVATMLRLAREREELRVVDDQVGTPTYTRDAALAVRCVVEADLRGTIHATNNGETTWYGLARRAIEAAGLQVRLVPITTEEYPTPARRPLNSRLENRVLSQTIGDPMRDWREALADYVAETAGARQ